MVLPKIQEDLIYYIKPTKQLPVMDFTNNMEFYDHVSHATNTAIDDIIVSKNPPKTTQEKYSYTKEQES